MWLSASRHRRIRRSLLIVVVAGTTVVVVSGAALHAADSSVVSTLPEGVWWALALSTTAGFAGESPSSVGGYVVSGITMLLGFWLLTLTTAALASLLVIEEEEPAQEAGLAIELQILNRLDDLADRLERLERQTIEGQSERSDT